MPDGDINLNGLAGLSLLDRFLGFSCKYPAAVSS